MSVRVRPRLRDLPPEKLLAVLWPQAELRAEHLRASGGFAWEEASPLLQALQPYLYPGNVEGARITRRRDGRGWEGDVLLRSTPPAVPNAIGTPQIRPRATPNGAVQDIVTNLALILTNSFEGVKTEKEPWFCLYDLWMRLPDGFAAVVEEHSKKTGIKEERTHDQIGARLDFLVATLLPAGVTEAGFRALDREDQIKIYAAATSALFAGMFRWPRPTPDKKTPGT